jgi:hypothetical protein
MRGHFEKLQAMTANIKYKILNRMLTVIPSERM